MWDKLLALFKETNSDGISNPGPNIMPPPQSQSVEAPAPRATNSEGRSTHIGYNYLKGMDDAEDSSKPLRKFLNLNKLLRGDYRGKITSTDDEPAPRQLRGEDDE